MMIDVQTTQFHDGGFFKTSQLHNGGFAYI
jgi:hypothetical protein